MTLTTKQNCVLFAIFAIASVVFSISSYQGDKEEQDSIRRVTCIVQKVEWGGLYQGIPDSSYGFFSGTSKNGYRGQAQVQYESQVFRTPVYCNLYFKSECPPTFSFPCFVSHNVLKTQGPREPIHPLLFFGLFLVVGLLVMTIANFGIY